MVWSASEALNLYANLGRGFETPTLAESAYSAGSTGPNRTLQASHSLQAEIGVKWRGDSYQLDAAWFDARSRDEIVPAASINGRSIYQNADRVRRRGLEMAWSSTAGAWRPQLAYTLLDAFLPAPTAMPPVNLLLPATACLAPPGTPPGWRSPTIPTLHGNGAQT